jgi:tetratricopeptide (TPR) repeat protein
LKESKVKSWIGKIDNALANAFVRQQEWRLAITSYQLLLEQSLPILAPAQAQLLLEKAKTESVPVSLENNESSVSDALYAALEIEILSRQGRILLQVGALEEASVVFDTAANAMQRLEDTGITIEFMSKSLAIQQAPAQVLLNEGLLQFSNHTYASAMESFTRALEWLSQPKGGTNKRKSNMGTGNLLLLYNPSTIAQDVLGPGITCDSNHNVMTECLNNLALCALYQCQMHKAVNNMESLVRQNPTLYLTEGLVFNLCTLYELGSDTADSGRKKRVLQSIAKRFFLHDIGPESFRIT